MTDREFTALTRDIEANGLREPIWLHQDGRIIDGRHRYRACINAGVEPQFRTWDETGSLVAFVVSLNLHRRHLDESQRAMVAAKIANLPVGANQHAQISAPSQKDAAEMLSVSRGSVQNARRVLDEGALELVEAVERGDVAVSAAASITDLERDDQAAIVSLPPEERKEAIKAHVAHNSGNNEWYTPAEYVEPARKLLGGFDLDPASHPDANKVVKAKRFFTKDDDGLTQKWEGRVWMNPPYAQPLVDQFSEKLVAELATKSVTAAVVLVNNATETGWFSRLAGAADAVCFPTGRVRFWNPDKASATPLQGQAILYFGSNWTKFHALFADLGTVWVKP